MVVHFGKKLGGGVSRLQQLIDSVNSFSPHPSDTSSTRAYKALMRGVETEKNYLHERMGVLEEKYSKLEEQHKRDDAILREAGRSLWKDKDGNIMNPLAPMKQDLRLAVERLDKMEEKMKNPIQSFVPMTFL